MNTSRIEMALFTARTAMERRAEAARLRADLLGEKSNDFDRSLDRRRTITTEEEARVDRLCDVSNRASEVADVLEDRLLWLKVAEDALDSAASVRGTEAARTRERKERGLRRRRVGARV